VLLCTRGALESKVTSSLTDVWQQLFEQQDITDSTVHFHPWLHENAPVHQCLETPTETETQEHVYQKPARNHELKWHLIEIWSATSRASLINR